MVNGKTVGAFLNEQHTPVNQHDKIDPAADTKVTNGMKVTVDPAFQVTVNDAGKKRKYGRLRLRSLTFNAA